jgi:hypothetical protein
MFIAYTLQMRLPPADKLTGASSAMLVLLLLLPLLLLLMVCQPKRVRHGVPAASTSSGLPTYATIQYDAS